MPDDPILALALRLTDGEAIDWKAESRTGCVDLSLLQILEQIEAVARAHGSADAPTAGDVAAGVVGGALWGHLEIVELIGSGSYGDVYRAHDTRLGREVALKLLRTRNATESDSSSLVREGHLVSLVRHPNVVTVYGADCLNGQTGLWMELVEGETLEQEVQRRGALEADEVAQIGAILSDALEAVHGAGLLHRDVKAQNVMRDRAGRLVLMDFGSGYDARRFTGSTVEGTPLYAAPEVLNGGAASVRSDIYSLGVLLWHLLTGNYPVNARSVDEIKRAHALGPIAKLESSGAHGAVARIAADCLAIDPGKRPPSAGALGRRLCECTQPAESYRRSVRNWTGLAGFAAAVLLLSTTPLSLSITHDAGSLGGTDRQVWSSDTGSVLSGPPSVDGRYFACVSSQGRVGVCDITTGIVRPLPITIPTYGGGGGWVFGGPLLSPDGKRLAYKGSADEVRILDLSTSTLTSLKADPTLKLIDWKASGDSLLVVLSQIDGEPPVGSSVALLDIGTGILTRLNTLTDFTEGDRVALSHDGRYLAFTQRGKLYVADILSGATRHFDIPSTVSRSLLWTPNDDGVLFTSGSDTLESTELRLMRLADGLQEVLRPYKGRWSYFLLQGVSATGDLYYFQHKQGTLHLAPFDAVTQKMGAPVPIARLPSGAMDWSPDSQSIAYADPDTTKALPTIVIRNVEASVERQIHLPDDSVNHDSSGFVRWIRWSPQGTIFAIANSNYYLVDSGETSVRRIAVTSQTPTSLSAVEWTPDGSTLLFAGNLAVQGLNVVTGLVTEYAVFTDMLSGAELSPQPRLVAFTSGTNATRYRLSWAAFDEAILHTVLDSDRYCRGVGWWRRKLFVACYYDGFGASHGSPLYLLDVDNGEMKALNVNLRVITRVRVRPDDGAVAISTFGGASTFVLKVPRR